MKIHQIFISQSSINPSVDKSYFYVIADKKKAIAFDPGLFTPIDNLLTELNLDLVAILNTHHHPDHVGANIALQKKYKCPIYASLFDKDRVPGLTNTLTPGEPLSLLGLELQVLDLKAHTKGLVGYYNKKLNALFPGDALFSGGCGRLFEGTPQDLLDSMKTVAKLPKNTLIYCSHEYTLQNLKFAMQVDSQNTDLHDYFHRAKKLNDSQSPTVPTTLELELKINPFLRVLNPTFLNLLNEKKPVVAIKKLRQQKDQFRS